MEAKTIVIAGGNSGVGLQAAREFLAAGHRVILLGRDNRKGESALASFGDARSRAAFLSVDLSTHAGVRDAAQRIKALTDRIDGLVHSAAVFETRDVRTVDGLPVFVALSYISRYHLTQLLLPELLRTEHPRVMMLTATLKTTPKLKPELFPYFKNFKFFSSVAQVNGASLYYADHLTKTHPKIFAGCASPGFVRTEIFRDAPGYFKAFVALTAPFFAIDVEKAAHNVVQAIQRGDGPAALNWPTPGNFGDSFAIETDEAIREAVMDASRQVTGV